jgi:hypothetical protein
LGKYIDPQEAEHTEEQLKQKNEEDPLEDVKPEN